VKLASSHLRASLVALLAAGTLLALLVVNVLTLEGIRSSRPWMARTREVQSLISRSRGALLDTETGQRGYLLTGDVAYLEPFTAGEATLRTTLPQLKQLTESDPSQRYNATELERLATEKLAVIRQTVALRQSGDTAAALSVVRSNEGKVLMDRIRRLVEDMRAHEDGQLEVRTATMRRNFDRAASIDMAAGAGLVAVGFVLFAIHRDLRRREALEAALREEARFQQQFIAILSHDLRNPLSAITMSAAQLQRSLSVDRLDVGQRIESSAARMKRMIDQLLDLTRARLGDGIPVSPKPETSLRDVVHTAVEELRTAHPSARVRVELGEDVRGAWDPDRMSEVVSNLVANAIRYGDGTVDIRVAKADTGALLEIHNHGDPIPTDDLPTIFAPFRRAAHGKESNGQGLGLGLFITERIVAAHGGRLTVRSTISEGTTFLVGLPTAAATEPSEEPSSASPKLAGRSA
jgi:signal transduction histidine kinase